MSNKTTSVNVGGGSGAILLTALLAYLKINGHLAISWTIVFLPLWAGLALFALVGVFVLLIAGIVLLFEARKQNRRRKF